MKSLMIAKKIKILIVTLGLLLAFPAAEILAGGIKWEKIASVTQADHTPGAPESVLTDFRTDENARLYLWLSKPATVRIVTILGQQISLETLQPGCYRIKMPVKGIYILKVGDMTKKVVV